MKWIEAKTTILSGSTRQEYYQNLDSSFLSHGMVKTRLPAYKTTCQDERTIDTVEPCCKIIPITVKTWLYCLVGHYSFMCFVDWPYSKASKYNQNTWYNSQWWNRKMYIYQKKMSFIEKNTQAISCQINNWFQVFNSPLFLFFPHQYFLDKSIIPPAMNFYFWVSKNYPLWTLILSMIHSMGWNVLRGCRFSWASKFSKRLLAYPAYHSVWVRTTKIHYKLYWSCIQNHLSGR